MIPEPRLSWAREAKARHAASTVISACLSAVTYIAGGSLTLALVVAVLMLFMLELSWVLFAFEPSDEYRAVRNRDSDALLGARGIVSVRCSPQGQVKLWGELWQAESRDGSPIAVGDAVVVTGTKGLVLLVSRQ